MGSIETAKAQTEISGSGLRNVEQLCGRLDATDSKLAERLQVTKLIRTFAISAATAAVIAELAWCSR
jgi:hypothetical protein